MCFMSPARYLILSLQPKYLHMTASKTNQTTMAAADSVYIYVFLTPSEDQRLDSSRWSRKWRLDGRPELQDLTANCQPLPPTHKNKSAVLCDSCMPIRVAYEFQIWSRLDEISTTTPVFWRTPGNGKKTWVRMATLLFFWGMTHWNFFVGLLTINMSTKFHQSLFVLLTNAWEAPTYGKAFSMILKLNSLSHSLKQSVFCCCFCFVFLEWATIRSCLATYRGQERFITRVGGEKVSPD